MIDIPPEDKYEDARATRNTNPYGIEDIIDEEMRYEEVPDNGP